MANLGQELRSSFHCLYLQTQKRNFAITKKFNEIRRRFTFSVYIYEREMAPNSKYSENHGPMKGISKSYDITTRNHCVDVPFNHLPLQRAIVFYF